MVNFTVNITDSCHHICTSATKYKNLASACLISLCLAIIITTPLALSQSFIPDLEPAENGDRRVGKCEACRALVKSFDQGMEATARGKHEGGDTSWEERNLKSYADSEVRLVEIQEQLCLDLKEGKAECLAVAEDTESDIEEWWFKHRTKNVRLVDFLCISRLKKCCPEGKYGPSCQQCLKNCGKNGKCSGSGTREGDGSCKCDQGYTGELCQLCTDGYYGVTSDLDDGKQSNGTCLKCDQACVRCDGPGPLNCQACAKGYKNRDENGCVDINECELEADGQDRRNCHGNTYCVNTEGSSECQECHKSCQGCYGFGSTMCIKCASGYQAHGNSCLKEGTQQADSGGWIAQFKDPTSNYYMYLLAFLVAVIIFNQNLKILAFFSVGLIIFITLTETNKGIPSTDTLLSASN